MPAISQNKILYAVLQQRQAAQDVYIFSHHSTLSKFKVAVIRRWEAEETI